VNFITFKNLQLCWNYSTFGLRFRFAPVIKIMMANHPLFYVFHFVERDDTNTYITPATGISGWTTGNDYQNNNGNPPPDNSYPPGYTVNSTTTSQNLYKLNATTNMTGLGIVLKVMAGDKIDNHGKSFYSGTQTYDNSNSTLLTPSDIVGAFIGSPDNA
jgi:hypothetical protein